MTENSVRLNPNLQGLSKSATLAINEQSFFLEQGGKHIYRFGLGQSPFPVPDAVVAALRANAHQKDYLEVQGLYELRQAVAAFLRLADGIEVAADNIMIGPGSKELMFLLQLSFRGEILIPSPSWVSYLPQARILGKTIGIIPTKPEDHFSLSAERLDAYCSAENDLRRSRLLILNYPSNPTGSTYQETELEDIAEVARRYDIIVLSDEIYGQIHHDGKHRSLWRFYPERTIVSSGLSKWCGAGGWRLGTFAFPEQLSKLQEAMVAVASETYTSVSAPIQFAAIRAFERGAEIDHYLGHSRKILKALGIWIYQTLMAADVLLPRPSGAFYAFPDFTRFRPVLQQRGITTSAEFCDALLKETGVALLPGVAFGRNEHELTCRLAYVNFDGTTALEASYHNREDALSALFLRQYCPEVLEGIERLLDWLNS